MSAPLTTSSELAMRVIAATLLTLALAACSGDPISPPNLVPVASVTLEPVDPVVGVGAMAPLTATTKSQDGTVLANRVVTYATGNSAIATVDEHGVVTGIATGSTQITATSEGKSGSVTLTVSSTPVASVTVGPPSLTLNVGATATLTGAAFDAGGAPLPRRVFAWSSSDLSVATVTSLGVVLGVGPGTATITGTCEGKSATATVTAVVPPVATVTVTPSTATVGLGDSLQLTATVKDADGHTLGGRVVTWQTSNPLVASVTNTGKVRGLGVGEATITATSEGKSGTAAIGGRLRFASVSAGQDFSCGVTPVHTIYCWGRNVNGSLGDGTSTNRLTSVPVTAPVGVTFDSVSAGQDHACAVSTTGDIYCWGSNALGQLGSGDTSPRDTPTRVSAGSLSFTSVSAAAQFTCALTTGGLAECWGTNDKGQLGTAINVGVEPPVPNTTPQEVTGGPFKAVSATQGHACGILSSGGLDGIVTCWGLNDAAQLGRGGGTSPPFDQNPQPIFGSVRYAKVSGGFRFTCAIRADGSGAADCWGLNDFGQLGSTTVDPNEQSTPVPVVGGLAFARVSAGRQLACGVTLTGVGFCWGDNTFGQLGIGSATAVPTPPQPRPVSGSLTFGVIEAGYFHACGVTTDKVAWCWGRAQDGLHADASALGNGAAGPSNIPVKVSGQD